MNAPLHLLAASALHPFPGLRPFAYQDHEYFFGRDDQTYALYRLIDRSRFIAVVGSSGSGKSSLVRAGLLPLLDTETRDTGGRNWLWRDMRPGDAPLQRLTSLLASLSIDDDPVVASGRRERIAAQLQRSSFGISEALAETNGVGDRSVVLVIDQFEELFRYAGAALGKTGLGGDELRARDEATQFVQLLLEASRTPSNKINVMLTMRSDFIGDCARFHGLPEAVCAAQFLVPSLTRDQLDEVIRKPVEQAGASIDPELVERLLNDCSTEMDQLPVLQHCLARLWEEAGKVPPETTAPSGAEPAKPEAGSDQGAARCLSLNHYRSIGEFADALSRHADEILKDLPGPTLQLAVEQTFSALSELDKEGRAIRRALRFSQLVAEAGVDQIAVRQVLDRFRADDCSFLTPSLFEVKELADTTRVDVGHEALLRRWEKVSGRAAELGWLRAEQQAGERYRSLLAMAEGDDPTLPSHLVDERWAWWKARPRTEAWAERYGGGFARVRRLLQVSQVRQRAKRWAFAAAFIMVLGAAGAMAWLWWTASNAKLEATENLRAAVQAQKTAERAQADADRRRTTALQTTKTSIGRLAGFLNDGTVSAEGAKQFLADARETLDDMANTEGHSPDISQVEMSLLLTVSDVNVAVGLYDDALALARRVENISEQLVRKYPDNPNIQHLVFAAKFRIGDELARRLQDSAAEKPYREAFATVSQLASSDPADIDHQRDVAFIRNKLGDLLMSRRDWQAAMDEFNAGMQIAEAIAENYPGDIATQKNRIAQLLSERGEPGDDLAALAQYKEALAIQTRLLIKTPGDATLLSNMAMTHRRIGGMMKAKPDEARLEYEAAVANHKKLYEGDPGNVTWRHDLAVDYTLLGDVLMQKEAWSEASQDYDLAAQTAEGLVLKDPGNVAWQQSFAVANMKRGDTLIRLGNDAILRPQPVLDASSRLIEDALGRYRVAADDFAKLANNPKGGSARYRNLFEVRIKIADVLVRQDKYKEALEAYQSASAAAEQAEPVKPIADWQTRLSASLEQAGDSLTRPSSCCQFASREDTLAFYQRALALIQAAAIKQPDNQNLQAKKSAITAKIEGFVESPQSRVQ